jgi:NDP-sugar pyrophosphorylase family protein
MIEPGKFTMAEDDLFQDLLRDGAPLYAYRHDGYWLDVGTVPRYLQAQKDALAGRFPRQITGQINNEYSQSVENSGNLNGDEPSLLGNNCHVAADATLRSATLGDGVHVAEGAVLQDSVIYDGASIGAGAMLRRTIIGPGVQVPPGARLEDEMLFTSP